MAAVDPLALGRDAQANAVALADEAMAAQPTPTQEENDLAKLGLTKGDNGDIVDTKKPKAADAAKAAAYQTRDAKPE